jgi:predicted lipid-binding transport protein (Tim44 family)
VVPAANQAQIDVTVAAIKAVDPTFTLDGFLSGVTARFLTLKQAWAAGDIDTVRPLLGDGLYSHWQVQLSQQKSAGVRNILEGLLVLTAQVLAAAHTDSLDRMLVGIEYQAAHFAVGLNNRMLFGSFEQRPFVEFWTFARPAGAVPATTCPRCGAPLEISPQGLCRFCRATLPPGLLGWIALEAGDEFDWSGFNRPAG